MANEQNKQKQGADMDTGPEQVQQGGFTAEELGQASIYDDSTVIAQQMHQGDESKGDSNVRDVVGTTDFKDTDEKRTDQDTVLHNKNTHA